MIPTFQGYSLEPKITKYGDLLYMLQFGMVNSLALNFSVSQVPSLLSKAMRYLNGYCPRFKVYVPGAPETDFIGKPIGVFFFQLK